MGSTAAGSAGPELNTDNSTDNSTENPDNVESICTPEVDASMTDRDSARPAALLAGLILIVVGLLVFGAFQAKSWRDAENRDDARTAVLQAARQEVIALTTISAKTSDADINKLLDGATKGFRSEFAAQADNFRSALKSGDVASTGVVTAAGLHTLNGNTAEVLVAASGTVSNKLSETPQPRNYRLRLGMEKVNSRWLVASLEFVS